MKNRSLAHCSEYDFWKFDFTPSKMRENEILLCGTAVMSTMDNSDFKREMNSVWGGDLMRRSPPDMHPTRHGYTAETQPLPGTELLCIRA